METLALSILGGHQRAHCRLKKETYGNNPYSLRGVFGERAVAKLHGVHLRPGHPTPAAVAPHGHLIRDAGHRVLGDDDRMPLVDLAATPDPHRAVPLDGCWLIEGTPPPITAPCGQYHDRQARAADREASEGKAKDADHEVERSPIPSAHGPPPNRSRLSCGRLARQR